MAAPTPGTDVGYGLQHSFGPLPRSWRRCIVVPPVIPPPVTDVDCVWVNPARGVQTLEMRFGPGTRPRVDTYLQTLLGSGWDNDDDDDNDATTDEYYTDDPGPLGVPLPNFVPENGPLGVYDFPLGDDIPIDGASNYATLFQEEYGQDSPYLANDVATAAVNPPATLATGLVPEPVAAAGEPVFAASNPTPTSSFHTARSPSPALLPPLPARARLNLMALSQRYNLCFVAYGEKIHVYRPQPAPEIFRGPLLVLAPRPSQAAPLVGGYISEDRPHQVNHMVVGDLGNVEILLLAFDDGDVVAYYTHKIVSHLVHSARFARPPHPLTPFFTETVGMSAWGLAIHAQSRLIAVSSNLAEVTVFAFGLDRPDANAGPAQRISRPFIQPHADKSPRTASGATALQLESLLRLRDRRCRILLPLPPGGSNIPNIDFSSDAFGYAEKVVAIDISGITWFLDIWTVGSYAMKVMPSANLETVGFGWGIMAIPTEKFLPTKLMPASEHQWFGVRTSLDLPHGLQYSTQNDHAQREQRLAKPCYEIGTSSMEQDSDDTDRDDRDVSETARVSDRNSDSDSDSDNDTNARMDQNDDGTDEDSDMEMIATYPLPGWNGHGNTPAWDVLMKGIHSCDDGYVFDPVKDARSNMSFGLVICPSIGMMWTLSNVGSLVRMLRNAPNRRNHVKDMAPPDIYPVPKDGRGRRSDGKEDMARRYFILRTYARTVEIFSINANGTSYCVHNAVSAPTAPHMFDMQPAYHRFSLVHFIPEISLIVVGNMFGRVILLRPLLSSTPPSRRSRVPPCAFRTEWVLPLRRDEHNGLRPSCCLLGLAVSRVPENHAGPFGLHTTKRGDGGTSATGPRRWRIIMHYMDHTILQYYIEEKKPKTGMLHLHAV